MRTIGASLVLIAACSSAAKSPQTPAAQQTAAASNDSSLFPASWPSLRDAEAGGDPARVAQLAQTALGQLEEEYELSTKDAAHAKAYERLNVRLRIVQDNAWIVTGRSLEALADVAKQPFACPAIPQHTRDACDSLTAALTTAFPNVIAGPGKIAQVDQALVIGDATSETEITAFMKKASAFQGSVVQRMRLSSASSGVLKIGTLLQVRVPAKQKLGTGDVVWVAFEPRRMKNVGKMWDLANAHVLFVEPQPTPP